MIELHLNEKEAQVLLQMIDLSVKSQGLAAAEAGLHLAKKITEPVAARSDAPQQTEDVGEVINACGECEPCKDCEPCEECSLCAEEKALGIMEPSDSCNQEQQWCYSCDRPAVVCVCENR